MAQKRMFSLQVTDTDRFLDKPLERRPKPPTQEEHREIIKEIERMVYGRFE